MITLLLLATNPVGLAPAKTATLPCGRGTFTSISQQWAPGVPRSPYTQSLSVDVVGKRQPIALDRTRLVTKDGKRVRNRYLSTWACVTATSGAQYVWLGYACAIDPGYPNDCGGEREWSRLLDDRGRAVDRGVPVNGPARTRLDDRLGLSELFEAGVRMQDVLE